jgi:hypothetical protein
LSQSSSHPLLDVPGRLTCASVADLAGVHELTVRRWINVGVRGVCLPAYHIGGRIYIDPVELRKFLDQIQGVARA